MKAILFALFVALLMVGCEDSTPEIEEKPTSLVADVDEVVEWVMDNYSSMEDGFAGAENDLRSSDAPAIKILDDLAKLVSDRRIQSEDKKKKLIALKEQLEGKKVEIEKEMTAADSSMRDSYDLALEKIEGKLGGKIKPLLDFDFQYLEKFERDLNASTLEWKRYLRISDGVLDEGLIRNELANRISAHFRDNMAKPIEERREKWGGKDTSGTEQSEEEQANDELVHARFSFGGNELQIEKESKDSDPSLRETYENAPPEIVGEPEAMEVEDKQVTIIKRSKERVEQLDKSVEPEDPIVIKEAHEIEAEHGLDETIVAKMVRLHTALDELYKTLLDIPEKRFYSEGLKAIEEAKSLTTAQLSGFRGFEDVIAQAVTDSYETDRKYRTKSQDPHLSPRLRARYAKLADDFARNTHSILETQSIVIRANARTAHRLEELIRAEKAFESGMAKKDVLSICKSAFRPNAEDLDHPSLSDLDFSLLRELNDLGSDEIDKALISYLAKMEKTCAPLVNSSSIEFIKNFESLNEIFSESELFVRNLRNSLVGVATDSPAEMEKKIEARTKVEVFKGSIEASGKGLEKSKEYIVDLLMNKELKLAIQEIAFLQKEIGVFVGRVRSFKADIK